MAVRTPHAFLQSIEGVQLDLKDKERYTLLHFFTFGCINCLNSFAKIKVLEQNYNDLKTISIQTPKFFSEANVENLKHAIGYLQITHDVVMDSEQKLWSAFAVKAWPTFVLIDPNGYIIFQDQGELALLALETALKNRLSFGIKVIESTEAYSAIVVDNKYRYLATQNDIYIYLDDQLCHTIRGFSFIVSLMLFQGKLYISDRIAGAVFIFDIAKRRVIDQISDLRAPWATLVAQGKLYIALAGKHQIGIYDLQTKVLLKSIGNGFEGLRDGCDTDVLLAQPSGLAAIKERIYFIDAESSSLRYLEENCVTTLFGEGLFSFGDSESLMQHPQSISGNGNNIYIADTYNAKIKCFDGTKKRLQTVLMLDALPISLCLYEQKLYIICLNKKQILIYDLVSLVLKEWDVS